MLDLILQQARDSEPGFARKTIKWGISCDADGRFTGVVSLGEGKGRGFDACPQLSQPELVGGGEPRAHFLADALPTVLLYLDAKAEDKDREKYLAKHAYFTSLLAQASESVPYLRAAAHMLEDETALEAARSELATLKAKSTDSATLIVDGFIPVERDEWRDWWRRFRTTLRPAKPAGNGAGSSTMRCVVTGERIEPAATHPKIKGLAGVGGLGTGDVLVGFDKAAFQSYGLEQSANAAMSERTATAYAETLNRLTERGIKLGSVLVVHWYDQPVADDENLLSWIVEPPVQRAASAEASARDLLTAIRQGTRPDLGNNRYVALLLSGQAGRVMVREVMQGRFEELAANVDAWFADLAIVARDGRGNARPPKFLAVAGSLVRDPKDLPSPWMQQLWRAAVGNGPIPHAALAQATLRARIDIIKYQPPNHARMGLMRAFHVRQGDQAMRETVNPDHPEPAYHCGRLLAVLASLQYAALGDVGAGVVQRYYTAASQTPGLILGRLAANAKNHLNKLDGGLAHWYEDQIAQVMCRIGDYAPSILTLEQQSLFALGYYQQLAASRTPKAEKNGANTPSIASESPETAH